MNTIFLMQDSENIFELTPIERLTILKNVFNLLGIDEAKDTLADKKRDIRYKIKSKTDISSYDKKLQNNVQNYLSIFEATEQLIEEKIDMTSYKNFFDERKMVSEKITINEFSLKEFPHEREEKIQQYIEKEKEISQKIQHQLETIQERIKDNQKKIKEQETEENVLSKDIQELEKKIEAIDEKKIEAIKNKKKELTEKIKNYEEQLPKTIIRNFITTEWSNHITQESDITMANVYVEIQGLINKGKTLHETVKHLQAQVQNEELQAKNETEKTITQSKYLEEKIFAQKNQLEKVKKTLQEMEKNIETQATFECEKIHGNCPFIKVINKKNFEQLEKQKSNIIEEQKQIKEIISTLTAEIKSLKKTELKQDTKKIEILQKEQKNTEKMIEIIKTFLNEIDYKTIEKSYSEYITKEKEIKYIDQQITTIEQEIKKTDEWKLQLQKAITQKETLQKTMGDIVKTIAQKEEERKKLEQEKEQIKSETILQIEKNHLSMKQIHHDIEILVDEFKEHQLDVQKLKEQETILWNLYTIFSKELLLLVLQDHLPILNDIINTYLAQIVDYQIHLHLNKNNTDKLELEAKILDSKGERETKSLSWWQRIILKLIWMLAISSYINSPILFLDETINNLDTETVGKVADMLEDFVKQRDIKFYTITHSQQIQEMDIRDQTIDLTI